MTTTDPFATAAAGLVFRERVVHTSRTHYYIAAAFGQSPSLIGETADLAALWVFLTPPAKILQLERKLRTQPDAAYSSFFAWLDAEPDMEPGGKGVREARSIVEQVIEMVMASRDEVDPDSIDGDGEGMPGKSPTPPDMPPE